jgi:hypothetical protein
MLHLAPDCLTPSELKSGSLSVMETMSAASPERAVMKMFTY